MGLLFGIHSTIVHRRVCGCSDCGGVYGGSVGLHAIRSPPIATVLTTQQLC
jgi:hypothetical protein